MPRSLIAAVSGLAALALMTSAAGAHGSGGVHHMPGAGGAPGPGMMNEMGADMIDLMGRWMRGLGSGEHPDMSGRAPTDRQVPAIPDMPGPGMAPGTGGPRMPQMPQLPDLPGHEAVPGLNAPGLQMQMAPGWWG